MKKFTVLIALAMVVAACGGGAESADTTAVGDVGTTVAAETSTTAAATATSAAGGTTTTVAETATTAGGSASSGDGLSALLGSSTVGQEMTSGRIEGVMTVVGAETEDAGAFDLEVPFSSTFDSEANVAAITMDLSGMADSMTDEDDPFGSMMLTAFEMRQIGDDAYIKMPFLSTMLGSDAEWILMPADQSGEFTSGMGVQTDPYEMLDGYRDANADIEELGTETVNGVEATHYRVLVDTESYLATLSPDERAELEADGPVPTTEFPIELWISDDGFIVRMLMDIEGDQADFEGADSFQRMTITYNVFDINQPVDITAPEDYVSMDDLGGAFGGGDG